VRVLIDSSIWFAAVVERDKDNARARQVLAGIDRAVTTDHIVVETWLLLNSRHGRRAADTFADRIRDSGLPVEFATPADLDTAWRIMKTFPDQDFSIVDCTSFAVMERLGVHCAASFDHHFEIFRYGPRRDGAFEVLR
jgi:predicted nucleic acid-binding protein